MRKLKLVQPMYYKQVRKLNKKRKKYKMPSRMKVFYMVWNDKNAVGPTMVNPNPGIHRF